ncbi:MAG: hypothetical protein WCK35_15925 [Chloroflexota bacterium]
MAIVTRNDEIIASIHFENERLVVRAITQEDADRVLKIISVPYWIGTSKVVIMEGEEVSMHGSTLAYPGTKIHWSRLGVGGASIYLFEAPDRLMTAWIAQTIIPPTFEFQAVLDSQANND